jgi:hypothetical protein
MKVRVIRLITSDHSFDRAPADPRHAVLTWVSIYWFSLAGPAASVRIYYELAKTGEIFPFPKTTVPIGLSFFPKEIVKVPRVYVHIIHTYELFFFIAILLAYVLMRAVY